MDLTFVLDRLALGGGIWTGERMARLAALGFTHVLNLQEEFDERDLIAASGLEGLWLPTADDLQPKPAAFFERSVAFALAALEHEPAAVLVHCAAGVHRAPLATAAILCALGYSLDDAVRRIVGRRPVAEFPAVYLDSLRAYLALAEPAPTRK